MKRPVTLVAPDVEIARDRYDRPLVVPPGGGKRTAYTRCTTYVGVLEDTFNLGRWQQRMVATGLSMRPDLLLAVSAHHDDKDRMNKICEAALEAAKASAAATIGTALHGLTEQIDRGQDTGVVQDPYLADLEAYRSATADLAAVAIEQFCVLDDLKIGGTPDRVVSWQGRRYIADVKTGNVEYGVAKIAMQLAVYSRSVFYDPKTGVRTPHDAETDRGLVIHLPAGSGKCEVMWIDLDAGWEDVALAGQVRDQRRVRKFKDLTEPFSASGDATPASSPDAAPAAAQAPAEVTPGSLLQAINKSGSRADIDALWAKYYATSWTEEMTLAAKRRLADLGA